MKRSSHTEGGAPAYGAPPPAVLPEYRPDSVSVLRDRKGKVVSAVIEEERKRYWAAILARLPPKARRSLEIHMRKATSTRVTSPAGTTRKLQ